MLLDFAVGERWDGTGYFKEPGMATSREIQERIDAFARH